MSDMFDLLGINVRAKTLGPLPEDKEQSANNQHKSSENETNNYYEGYLTNKDATFILGYDACTDDMMKMMDKLNVYGSAFNMIGLDIHKLDYKIMDEDRDIDEYSEDELSTMSQETKILKLLQSVILDYAESERTNKIVSMIDNMDEESYFDIKSKVDKHQFKNTLIKSYDE